MGQHWWGRYIIKFKSIWKYGFPRWWALVCRPWPQGQDKGEINSTIPQHMGLYNCTCSKTLLKKSEPIFATRSDTRMQRKTVLKEFSNHWTFENIQVDEFLDFWQSSLNPAALALVQNVLMFKLFFRFERFVWIKLMFHILCLEQPINATTN